MPDASPPIAAVSPEPWPPVYADLVPHLVELVTAALTEAYAAQRAAEIVSNIESRAASNNIIDAFAHLGKLFMRAGSLSHEQQAAEVHAIGDHLKRAILEGPEEVLSDLLSEVADLWDDYVTQVIPLVHTGAIKAAGLPTEDGLSAKRASWKQILSKTRERKNGPDLAEAVLGADELSEIIEDALAFRDRLRSGLALAQLAAS